MPKVVHTWSVICLSGCNSLDMLEPIWLLLMQLLWSLLLLLWAPMGDAIVAKMCPR